MAMMTEAMNNTPMELERLELSAIEYVSRAVTALTAQAHVMCDPEYLRRFPPSQVAAVHSVMADKVARLTEVMQESNEHCITNCQKELL